MGSLPPIDELFPEIDRDQHGFLDLRGRDLRECDFSRRSLNSVKFGGTRDEGSAAVLTGVSFRASELQDVRFPHVRLEENDFSGADLRDCDFRVVSCARSSFSHARIVGCDFYNAYFEGAVVFSRTQLTCVSLDRAWLQGVSDLDGAAFERPSESPALVHEAADDVYARFLERTKDERLMATASGRPASGDIAAAVRRRRMRAAETYRRLSGIWTSSGQFDDATFAYVRSKELEREHLASTVRARLQRRHPAGPAERASWRDLGRYLALSLARWTCNYGDSLGRIALLVLALVLVPGTVYALAGAVRTGSGATVHSWATSVLFSLERITGSSTLHPATRGVELLGGLQTLSGIGLIGLFGFVLGNKIRNS